LHYPYKINCTYTGNKINNVMKLYVNCAMSKTVIMIWLKTHSGTNPNGSIKAYGLGDLLRGTIYLHQMSVRLGFNLVVDLSMHAISNYLIVNEHEHAAYVKANVNKLHFVDPHETTKFNVIYKASLGAKEPLLICTNMFCDCST
jgi:hypothetical protein